MKKTEYEVKECNHKECDIYGDESIFSARHKYCPFCGNNLDKIILVKK